MDARKNPTAPRKPTHEMKNFSRNEKPNGARHRNTATGRAISISVNATASAGSNCSGSRLGQASKSEQHEHHDLREPCHRVEKDDDRRLCARSARLPTIKPAR